MTDITQHDPNKPIMTAASTVGSAVSPDLKHEEAVAPAAKNILEDLGVNATLLATAVSSKFTGLINKLHAMDKDKGREF